MPANDAQPIKGVWSGCKEKQQAEKKKAKGLLYVWCVQLGDLRCAAFLKTEPPPALLVLTACQLQSKELLLLLVLLFLF